MSRFLAKLFLAGAVCWSEQCVWAVEISTPAKVLQHTSTSGEICSAVILKANELPKGTVAHHHVIVIDTSASQVGEHRQQTLAVLDALLKALPDGDKVRLFAADLQADALDDGFHNVRSTEVSDSIELLKLRVPLGATNLEGVLRTAMKAVNEPGGDITYIGDGLSTADLVEIPELRKLVGDLRQRRIAVHSFGVGRQRNLQILGILGLQTGGFVAFDPQVIEAGTGDDKAVKAEKTKSQKLAKDIARVKRSAADSALEQGKTLAAALVAPVFFSTQVQFKPANALMLPEEALPIRTDRETIYLAHGRIESDSRVVMTDESTGETLEWKLATAVEQPGATFLPVIIGQLSISRGLTNPLAGMTLFHLTQSDFSDSIDSMAQSGVQALQRGDIEQAKKISKMVLEADPNNETGKLLRQAIERLANSKKPADSKPTDSKPKLTPDRTTPKK